MSRKNKVLPTYTSFTLWRRKDWGQKVTQGFFKFPDGFRRMDCKSDLRSTLFQQTNIADVSQIDTLIKSRCGTGIHLTPSADVICLTEKGNKTTCGLYMLNDGKPMMRISAKPNTFAIK